jgi:hypothetical protein
VWGLIIGAGAFGFVLSLLAKQTNGIWWPIVARTLGRLIMVLWTEATAGLAHTRQHRDSNGPSRVHQQRKGTQFTTRQLTNAFCIRRLSG